MRRTTTRAGMPAALAVVLVLVGCAPATAPSGGGGEAASDGAAPAAEMRGPAIDLDCDGLLAAVDPAQTYGGDFRPTTVSGAGVGDYLGLASAATVHAGGLACAWESSADLVQLVVLPEATATWGALAPELATFQPHEGRFGTSFHACMAGCRADVLVGDRWLSATLSGSAGEEAAWSLVDRAVLAIAAAGPGDEPSVAAGATPDCAALVPDGVRVSAFGVPLAADARFAPTQPVLLHGAVLQQGGVHCFWMGDAGGDASVHVGLLPGGAAAWDAHWAVAPHPSSKVVWSDAPELGDAAKAGCYERGGCFVSVRAGDDWFSVDVRFAAGDHLAAATVIAEGVLAAL